MPSLPPAIDLNVRHRGRGQLVVGLHDLNHDGRQMLDALSQLPQREFRVVAPDLRGHGASPSPNGPWSIDDFASDVARIIADAGGPAIVVGQGVGGAAALALALGHPGLVSGLVVTGISPRGEDAKAQDRWTKVARILRERKREGIALTAEAMANRPDWRGALPQLDVPTVVLATTVTAPFRSICNASSHCGSAARTSRPSRPVTTLPPRPLRPSPARSARYSTAIGLPSSA